MSVQDKIAALQASFTEATAKKGALARQVADCEARLARAGKLIGGLGGEKARACSPCSCFQVA
jgi:dynein heavy chain, axonemal